MYEEVSMNSKCSINQDIQAPDDDDESFTSHVLQESPENPSHFARSRS